MPIATFISSRRGRREYFSLTSPLIGLIESRSDSARHLATMCLLTPIPLEVGSPMKRAWVIENWRYQGGGHSHQTITCEVIAAPRDLFDIRSVAVKDCLKSHRSQGESHVELSDLYDRFGTGTFEVGARKSCSRHLVLFPTLPASSPIHRNSSTPWLACFNRSTAAALLSRRSRSFF